MISTAASSVSGLLLVRGRTGEAASEEGEEASEAESPLLARRLSEEVVGDESDHGMSRSRKEEVDVEVGC
jgi:hypothetical protein